MQYNKEKLNLTLSPDAKAGIQAYAKQDGRSISEITNELYKNLIAGRQPVDNVITVQYLNFYRDGDLSQFNVNVFDNMSGAQEWIKRNYHYDQLDDDLVSCLKNDQGDVLDLRIGYEEDPDMLKAMVIVQKQMMVHEVK